MRAQITIFIALGLILIGIFGVIIYAGYLDVQAVERQAFRAPNNDRNAIEQFVKSCITTAATDGLRYMGKQGGAIYVNQGGSMDESGTIVMQTEEGLVRVAYGLMAPTGVAPNYPFVRPEISRSVIEHMIFQGEVRNIFGRNTMLPLCDALGPNRADNVLGNYTCPADAYGLGISMQGELSAYVSSVLPACVQSGLARYDAATQGQPNVQILLRDEDIMVYTNYTITRGNETMDQFAVTIPVRLKKMYEIVYRTMEEDGNNVSFDRSRDAPYLQNCRFGSSGTLCMESGFSASVVKNVDGYDDVFQVVDNTFLLDGKPFLFQVGMQNRRPMLDYIQRAGNGGHADILAAPGEDLILIPYGYDPDEDPLWYSYEGWGENSSTAFASCAEESAVPIDIANYAACAQVQPGQPHRWTTSLPYNTPFDCGGVIQTSRCAGLTLQDADKGLHKVKVSVRDDAGLSDYQEVSILVVDPLVALP